MPALLLSSRCLKGSTGAYHGLATYRRRMRLGGALDEATLS